LVVFLFISMDLPTDNKLALIFDYVRNLIGQQCRNTNFSLASSTVIFRDLKGHFPYERISSKEFHDVVYNCFVSLVNRVKTQQDG